MSSNHYVYRLVNPLLDMTVYIGKGFGNRSKEHNRMAHRGKHDNYQMQKEYDELRSFDMEFIPVIMKDGLTSEEALEWETKYIKWYGRKDLGTGDLLNLTDGGDSPPSQKGTKFGPRSEETKRKISASQIGKIISEETKKKQSLAKLGVKRSPEARAILSSAFKGRVLTAETKAKISAANKGYTRTDEAKAKMSAARTGYVTSDATKAKMRASHLRRKDQV